MKFKIFRFRKVNSTNNTAIRIIRNSNLNYGMVISEMQNNGRGQYGCLLYTSPSPRDSVVSRMPSSA